MKLRKSVFWIALLLASSLILSACNKEAATGDDTTASEDNVGAASKPAPDDAIENAFEGSEKPASSDVNIERNNSDILSSVSGSVDSPSSQPNFINTSDLQNTTESTQTVENVPFASEGETTASANSVSKTPTLFDVGDPTVFVVGSYNDAYCDELIAAVNAKRAIFSVPAAVKNPSLCLCANTRARESSFFNSHTRPNGTAFNTVASKYFMAECTAVTLKNANPQFIVDNWMDSYYCRKDMLNKDYMSIGACYFTVGDYSVGVVTFGY